MDVLKREMERKRREREELASKATLTTTGARFLRQADILQREEELRREKQRELDEQRRSQRLVEYSDDIGMKSLEACSEEVKDLKEIQPKEDKLSKTESESGMGSEESDDLNSRKKVRLNDDLDDHDEKRSPESKLVKKYPEGYSFSSDSTLPPQSIIRKYFKSLLQQWEYDLEQREDKEKNSAQGKVDIRIWKQCKDYIKPLFKLCKRNDVPPDILPKLVAIVKHCEEGNFKYESTSLPFIPHQSYIEQRMISICLQR